jgi:hypothetical protein
LQYAQKAVEISKDAEVELDDEILAYVWRCLGIAYSIAAREGKIVRLLMDTLLIRANYAFSKNSIPIKDPAFTKKL